MTHSKEDMLRIALMNAIDTVIGSLVGYKDEDARSRLVNEFGISPELADAVYEDYKDFIKNPRWDI